MTQSQMTAYFADRIGISKRQAKSALDELNELVTRQLKKKKVHCASQASEFSVSASLRHASGVIRLPASRLRFRPEPDYVLHPRNR
jgi:hypothetical protein